MKIRLSVEQAAPPWPVEWEGCASVERWQGLDGREYGFGMYRDTECWLRFHNAGSFWVQPGYSDIKAFPDDGVDPVRFQELFFHFVTPWILQRQQWDCLHASAVSVGGSVAAFCGPSGRGKSTLARAWCERGAEPYSDDSLPFVVRDSVVLAARIPQRPRLRGAAAKWFDRPAAPDGLRPSSGRLVYDPEPTLRSLRVIYWLEPRTTSKEPRTVLTEGVPPSEAFPILLGQSHFLSWRDPACNRKMVRNYLSLAGLVPVFRLSVPDGLEVLPAVMERLERGLGLYQV
jgi:hypothetical protein